MYGYFKQYLVVILLISAALLCYFSFVKSVVHFQSIKRKIYFYLLINSLFYLILFIGSFLVSSSENLITLYSWHELIFCMVGCLYCYFRFSKTFNIEFTMVSEILLLMLLLIIGIIFLLLACKVWHIELFFYPLLTSGFIILLPVAFYNTYLKALLIPQIVYQYWEFPLNEDLPVVNDIELKDPIIIGFKIQKSNNGGAYTFFRAKAPIKMDLGNLFYHFVVDYNDRHPDTPIEYAALDGRPSQWLFCSRGYYFNKRVLDPGKAVFMNQLKENSIILCKRINRDL